VSEIDELRPYFVVVRPEGAADIARIHGQIVGLIGVRSADAWEDGLYDALTDLTFTPFRQIADFENNRIAQNSPEITIRRMVYRKQKSKTATVIFFFVQDDTNAPGGRGYVHLLHARHGSQDSLTAEETAKIQRQIP
jgi:hypothetical protein